MEENLRRRVLKVRNIAQDKAGCRCSLPQSDSFSVGKGEGGGGEGGRGGGGGERRGGERMGREEGERRGERGGGERRGREEERTRK